MNNPWTRWRTTGCQLVAHLQLRQLPAGISVYRGGEEAFPRWKAARQCFQELLTELCVWLFFFFPSVVWVANPWVSSQTFHVKVIIESQPLWNALSHFSCSFFLSYCCCLSTASQPYNTGMVQLPHLPLHKNNFASPPCLVLIQDVPFLGRECCRGGGHVQCS